MTGRLEQQHSDGLSVRLNELETALAPMRPLLKQMHLLSSNAVSAAARAGSEGDAFRVLTHAIQELGQEIHQELQHLQQQILHCQTLTEAAAIKRGLSQLQVTLSAMPQLVKKGEYLAICAAVEAAHTENYGESFSAVAEMLKQLVQTLREQVMHQQQVMETLLSASSHR
jgi:methyl-accepting chemotaxis protein